MSTFFRSDLEPKYKQWQLVDARGQVVGRIATKIAMMLMGKDKPSFTPHVESGDGVVVINAAHVRMTGNKAKTKEYKFYSGYPSGQRTRTFEKIMVENPTHALKHAVKGMLPKSRLGKRMITHLLIYPEAVHPHQAQLAAGKSSAVKKPKTIKKEAK